MPTKHAVIIGINRYPFYEEKYHLAGCVNDARLMKHVLVETFDFPPQNICELHDEAATREAILAAMDRVAEIAVEDDIVVFHFSGHGRQRTSRSTTEGSGMDSTLMVSDSGPAPHPNLDIDDNTINEWLARLAMKTSNTTLIFDACHSGTMTRDVDAATARGIESDSRSPEEMGLTPLNDAGSESGQPKGVSGWLPLSDHYVVLSGCRDSQRSKEFDTEAGNLFERNGALTFYLTQALMNAKPGATYRDVYELAHQRVSTRFSTQNPQIEGPIDRMLFSTHESRPVSFIPVGRIDERTTTLQGGAAHGLRAGSEWQVYPHASREMDASVPCATLKIERVHATVSEASMTSSGASIEPLDRCILADGQACVPAIKVRVDPMPATLQSEVLRQLSGTSLVTVVTQDADVVLTAESTPEGWVILSENTAALKLPQLAQHDPQVLQKLLHNLEVAARYQNTLSLKNEHSALNVAFDIVGEQTTDFTVGDLLTVTVENGEDRSLWINILVLDSNGEISHAYPPNRMGEELRAEGSLVLEDIELNLNYIAADRAEQTFKAFFTTEPADFSWLLQDALRASLTPPSSLLRDDGEVSRSAPGQDPTESDWQAINRTFSVRKTP